MTLQSLKTSDVDIGKLPKLQPLLVDGKRFDSMGFILIFEFGIPLKISKIISNRKTIFPLSGMKNWSRTDIAMRLLSIFIAFVECKNGIYLYFKL